MLQVGGAALHKNFGNTPVRLLASSLKEEERLVIVLSSTGMVPVSEFVRSSRVSIFVIVLSSTGMVPVNKFEYSFSCATFVHALSSAGMVPVSEFEYMYRLLTPVHALSSAGMVPVRLDSLKVILPVHVQLAPSGS